jgi:hypothetical protein
MKGLFGHKQHAAGPSPSGQELHNERVAINQARATINEKTQFFRENFTALNLQIPDTIADIKPCESRIEEHIQATCQRKAESIMESQRLTQVIDTIAKERELQHSMHLKSIDVVKTFKAPAMKPINSVHLRAIAIPSAELVHTKIYEDVCRLHDIKDFDIILKKTPDVNEKSSHGRSPLDYATQYSFKHGIESLIQNEALCSDAFIYVLQNNLFDSAKLLINITANTVGHQEIFHNLVSDKNISELDLSDTSLSRDSLLYLSEPLATNKSLSTLNLSRNNIDQLGVMPISNMLSVNQHILNLDISNNKLAHQGIIILIDGLEKNTGIQILNISNNNIGLEGGVTVSRLLNNNNTILCLNVALNKIEDTGAAYILDSATKKGIIKQLNLASNGITDALAEDIEYILVKFPFLISLDLSGNNFSQNKALKIEELIPSTAEDKSNILLSSHDLNPMNYSLELLAETQIINDFE